MTARGLSILCTGDIHLGRHPTRIPEDADGPQFSPKAVWQATIEHAIEQEVDAVVVTGDVVDRENRYYEAYGAFEAGSRLLRDAGIPLIVVAGNHDYDTLPKMVADLRLDNVHVLGKGATWERYTLERDGKALIHFDGWSFATEHVHGSPLENYDLPQDSNVPIIGVVHADLDMPGSDYAPVSRAELLRTPAAVWLLGHVHKPGIHHSADPLILCPGSPQALNPTEQGTHGPWLLSIDGVSAQPRQLPLATVRYDHLTVDASNVSDPMDIPPLISSQLRERISTDVDTGFLKLILARVTLTGRSQVHARLQQQEEQDRIKEDLTLKIGTTPVCIETLRVDTKPDIDLQGLASSDTPAAWIAKLLFALDNGKLTDEYTWIAQDCVSKMQEAYGAKTYRSLRQEGWVDGPDRKQAIGELQRQARILLDTLLKQKERPS